MASLTSSAVQERSHENIKENFVSNGTHHSIGQWLLLRYRAEELCWIYNNKHISMCEIAICRSKRTVHLCAIYRLQRYINHIWVGVGQEAVSISVAWLLYVLCSACPYHIGSSMRCAIYLTAHSSALPSRTLRLLRYGAVPEFGIPHAHKAPIQPRC